MNTSLGMCMKVLLWRKQRQNPSELGGVTEVYTRMNSQSRRYNHSHREAETAITGHPATIVKLEDETPKVQEVDHDQVLEADKEQEDFLTHLRNY